MNEFNGVTVGFKSPAKAFVEVHAGWMQTSEVFALNER
jgi:hypothetical protein